MQYIEKKERNKEDSQEMKTWKDKISDERQKKGSTQEELNRRKQKRKEKGGEGDKELKERG